MKQLLFIGDSLMEFFDWQARFPGHKVANLGRAGETVEGLLSRVRQLIMRYPSPDMVFIMTGINNAAMEDFGFIGSYGKLLEELSLSYPHAGIFVHSLLPTLLPWISNESVEEMNLSLAGLAKEKRANYIDLYRRFINIEGMPVKEYLLPDGVHLSDAGYAVWAEVVEGIIKL